MRLTGIGRVRAPLGHALTRTGFLLSRQWYDSAKGLRLELWVSGAPEPLHITLSEQKAICFVDREVGAHAGRRQSVTLTDMQGRPVDALYFDTQRALLAERARLAALGVALHESDVKPVERYLMERSLLGSVEVSGPGVLRDGVVHMNNPRLRPCDTWPELRCLAVDIETLGLDGPLLSIAGAAADAERVFLVGGEGGLGALGALPAHVSRHSSAAQALEAFLQWVAQLDPDLIIGWNVIEFDLRYLAKLCQTLGRRFDLGRARGHAEVLAPMDERQSYVARVPGRVILDGISTLRSATYHFESYALEDVARELLGRTKKIQRTADPASEIQRMAIEDPAGLAAYNLEDCRLTLDIFHAAKLVEFAVQRQRLTGLPLDRQGGSVAAFDQLYLPRLHRAGFVAASVGGGESHHRSPGGYVMDSQPGLYKNVIVLDFKSLYPSIIRTFLIDPLGLARSLEGLGSSLSDEESIEGFEGARFARRGHILPELICSLWAARDQAKAEKNQALSRAIKIMMNSFYGVLGTPGCRFFDPRLVSSITLRGHAILRESREFVERRGLQVIYGDTDSVFVHLGDGLESAVCRTLGAELAKDLTTHFQRTLKASLDLESHLELEFETHFKRFLMPTIRDSEVGTKKRYAGAATVEDGTTTLVFKGLEVVRTDWTVAARRFQHELCRRVFADEPYESFVRDTARELLAGKLDEQLVYRKRLRRAIHDYGRSAAHHVQAARQLDKPGRFVRYVMTTRGPQPVEAIDAPLDYEHYLERQLAPAADSILHFLGTSFEALTGRQLALF